MAESKARIVLGVGGGIAAYKAADLVRRLQDRGFRVRVVMTRSARQFVTPLTFAALSGEKVVTDLFDTASGASTLDSAVEHIGVAQEADLLLVAPATADVLAKLAHGLADDFLTTTHLAFTGPVVVAPAMNTNMWEHPATQANLRTLEARGVHVLTPEAGELACGMVGPGRLAEPATIAAEVERIWLASREATERDLEGVPVLITAGPTQEPVDPVRYISNRSSGRMGYALAEEAQARGARVTIIAGPTAVQPPVGVDVVAVTTAAEMHAAVAERLEAARVIVMAAAVADYRPAAPAAEKIKKDAAGRSIELEPTADILKAAGERKGERILVGFAAETENLAENAARKLRAKHCDFLVANLVGAGAGGTGFETDENQGLLLSAAGDAIELPRESKRAMARRIWDRIAAELTTKDR